MPKPININPADGYFLLENGKIWNNARKDVEAADILLKDGIIERIGKLEKAPPGTRRLDLSGCLVFPGLIDIHVHLREPGFEERETIETGCAAAAAGGFTAVCCMANTNPVTDNQEVVQFIKEKAANNLVAVYPVGAVTKGLKGEELAEIGFMIEAGIVGISDDGMPVSTSGIMRRVLEYVKKFDIPVIEHAEDKQLTAGASMNESFNSTKFGLKGWPTIAEDIIVSRDILVADYVGGRLHFAHVSSAQSVRLIRQAKEMGVQVTAEAAPHHFCLTDETVRTYDTNYKMNPPLRGEDDVQALIEGLKDHTIDAVATDHAPHVIDDKDREFDRAAFGVTGLETAVGVYFTELIGKHGFGLSEFVNHLVVNPRKIINLDVPEILEGRQAELTIIDPGFEWKVEKDDFFSKADNSCFLGKKLTGKTVGTVGRKRLWWKNEMIK